MLFFAKSAKSAIKKATGMGLLTEDEVSCDGMRYSLVYKFVSDERFPDTLFQVYEPGQGVNFPVLVWENPTQYEGGKWVFTCNARTYLALVLQKAIPEYL